MIHIIALTFEWPVHFGELSEMAALLLSLRTDYCVKVCMDFHLVEPLFPYLHFKRVK